MKNGLDIVPVSRMDEVLKEGLVRQPVPIVWEEDQKPVSGPLPTDEDAPGLIAH